MIAFLRAALRALKSAFLAILAFSWETLLLPVRALGPPPGRSAVPPPPVHDLADDALPHRSVGSVGPAPASPQSAAAAAILWASDSLGLETPPPPPAVLGPRVVAWLNSLSAAERATLAEAGHAALARHWAGDQLIAGVRPFRQSVAVIAPSTPEPDAEPQTAADARRFGP